MANLRIFSDSGVKVKSRYSWSNPEISNNRKPLPTIAQGDGLLGAVSQREPRDG